MTGRTLAVVLVLLGIETTVTTISAEAFQENYTNEWGAQNTIRFLKILWVCG